MALKHTPLDALHRELGARMVPFAGYDMPVQYADGIIVEHRHTREHVGLFDVSHMGQFMLSGPGIDHTLESLIPSDLLALKDNAQTYALLTNDYGGVRDDLIVTRLGLDRFFLVVNASCKQEDREWIEAALAPDQSLLELESQALIALQGPATRAVLAELLPGIETLTFMHGMPLQFQDEAVYATCSGYTGEDGFELSLPGPAADVLVRQLLTDERVRPVGLGARDSLRLEAGLCLYGHELTTGITPIESGLRWAIGRSRRPDGSRAGNYPGASRIAEQLSRGTSRVRVGLEVLGKRPVREGHGVRTLAGEDIGSVTSGGFGASVDAPIAMALIDAAHAAPGTELSVDVRGKLLPVRVSKLPFVPHRYYRG